MVKSARVKKSERAKNFSFLKCIFSYLEYNGVYRESQGLTYLFYNKQFNEKVLKFNNLGVLEKIRQLVNRQKLLANKLIL